LTRPRNDKAQRRVITLGFLVWPCESSDCSALAENAALSRPLGYCIDMFGNPPQRRDSWHRWRAPDREKVKAPALFPEHVASAGKYFYTTGFSLR